MRFSLRPPRPLPALFFGLAGALALSLVLPLPRHGAILGLPSICPFFNLTGWPCPGCGLTRSWVSFAHGHLRESFAWHPLGPLLFCLAALYLVGTLRRWTWPSEKLVTVALATVLLVCWVLRLRGVFPLPS